MRALLLTDRDFTVRESPMVERLAVGLMGGGISAARAAPEDVAPWRESGLSPRATYRDEQLRWGWRACARDLVAALDVAGWGHDPIDIVHAYGRGSWRLALALAREFNVNVVLEIWSPQSAERLPGGKSRRHVAAYSTPSRAIAALLRSQLDPNLVSYLRWGVLAVEDADVYPPLSEPERNISVVIVASGQDAASCRACLSGFAAVAGDYPQLCVFLATPAEAAGGLHAICQELNLESVVSLVPLNAAARGLELQADVLVIPETLGEHRSFCLQAIANGRIVIAAEDRVVDYLTEDTVTASVASTRSSAWADSLRQVFADPQRARERAAEARAVVRESNKASDHVDGLRLLYERVIKGDTLSFDDARDSTDRGPTH